MRPLNPKLWLAPVAALIGFGTSTVFADVTEDCSVCGCLDCNNNGVDDRCDVACSNSSIRV